jgi:hypothetical protein
MAKNKDMEDLILLFLVIVLLVATVGMTQGREHMTEKIKAPTKEESYDKVASALARLGPTGTFSAFDTQLTKQEDVLMRSEEE